MGVEKKVLDIVDPDIAEEFRKISKEEGEGHFALSLPLQMHIARHLKVVSDYLNQGSPQKNISTPI